MKRYDLEISTLESALIGHLTLDELKPLAALTRKAKERLPTRKADLAQLVVRHLDGEGLRSVWQSLDARQQAAIAEVVHSDSPQFLPDRFRAKYGGDPDWGTANKWGSIRVPSALCFLFVHVRGCGSVMPADLKRRLAKFVPSPAEVTIETLDELPGVYERSVEHWNPKKKERQQRIERIPFTVHETERAAQRELAAVLRLVDAGKLAVSDKTRRPSAAAVKAVAACLDGGDYYPYEPPKIKWHDENAGPMRAFAWPLLMQAGGLAQLSGAKLRLTKAGRAALAPPSAPVLKGLWERWIDTKVLDELARIECVKGQKGKGKRGLTSAAGRRESIAVTLAACPAGRWIAVDELSRFARASDNDFPVSRDPWYLYIGDPQYGSLGYSGCEGLLESRYLFCLLFEYAATLGLIDVAYIRPVGARGDYGSLWGTDDLPFFSRYDGLMYIRINALGAYCLGKAREYSPTPLEVKPVLRVLPNLEIAAIGEDLGQSDRLALDAYAARESDRVWRLEPGKLLEAAEAGRLTEEIREFLAARSAGPLPETVARLLEDVSERCARVRECGSARLIECAEPALAALIANDTRTRKHCMRAGERHLVVSASSEVAFRRALREVGYLLSPGVDHGTTPAGAPGTAPGEAQLAEPLGPDADDESRARRAAA